MSELGKVSLNYDGELILHGLDLFGPAYEVKEKIPHGIIELKYMISIKKENLVMQERSFIGYCLSILSFGWESKLYLGGSLRCWNFHRI